MSGRYHHPEMVESLDNPYGPKRPCGARVDEACADMSARLILYGFVPGPSIRPRVLVPLLGAIVSGAWRLGRDSVTTE